MNRYGSNYRMILNIIVNNYDKAQKVLSHIDFLWAEIDYMVEFEFVESLLDIMLRRTQYYLLTKDRGMEMAKTITPYLAELKGWSSQKSANELEKYIEFVHFNMQFLYKEA